MRIVVQKTEDFIYFQKTKTIQNFASTCLDYSLGFQLKDELIPGINIFFGSTTFSNTLTYQSQKQKYDSYLTKPFAKVVFLNIGLKNMSIAFIDAYCFNVYMQNINFILLIIQVNVVITIVMLPLLAMNIVYHISCDTIFLIHGRVWVDVYF